MSWFYRFFKKSDDEQTVTVTAPAIALTGDVAVTGPFFLGSGTLGVFFGTATPWDTGINNADVGSMYCQTLGTGSIYRKYGYASKNWATLVATTSATY